LCSTFYIKFIFAILGNVEDTISLQCHHFIQCAEWQCPKT